jgi:hypothetical protein
MGVISQWCEETPCIHINNEWYNNRAVQLANFAASGQPIFVIKPLTNSTIDFEKTKSPLCFLNK